MFYSFHGFEMQKKLTFSSLQANIGSENKSREDLVILQLQIKASTRKMVSYCPKQESIVQPRDKQPNSFK